METIKTLHMTVGLPRSGKSTWATKQGYPIVDTDSIRLAMHGTAWNVHTEKMVWTMAHYMVRALFHAGHTDVILDSTNLTREHREEWICDEWETHPVEFMTSKEECIRRAKATNQEYLIPIIEDMDSKREPIDNDDGLMMLTTIVLEDVNE